VEALWLHFGVGSGRSKPAPSLSLHAVPACGTDANRAQEVDEVLQKFRDALKHDDGKDTLSPAGAADFLQKLGRVRTAKQRKEELSDVDVNGDGRTSFIEYLLLHYKIMIMQEHFKRIDKTPDVDMSNDGIGLVGVGTILIEEVFAPPAGCVGLGPFATCLRRSFSFSKRCANDPTQH
jgi:hypothetical protein